MGVDPSMLATSQFSKSANSSSGDSSGCVSSSPLTAGDRGRVREDLELRVDEAARLVVEDVQHRIEAVAVPARPCRVEIGGALEADAVDVGGRVVVDDTEVTGHRVVDHDALDLCAEGAAVARGPGGEAAGHVRRRGEQEIVDPDRVVARHSRLEVGRGRGEDHEASERGVDGGVAAVGVPAFATQAGADEPRRVLQAIVDVALGRGVERRSGRQQVRGKRHEHDAIPVRADVRIERSAVGLDSPVAHADARRGRRGPIAQEDVCNAVRVSGHHVGGRRVEDDGVPALAGARVLAVGVGFAPGASQTGALDGDHLVDRVDIQKTP